MLNGGEMEILILIWESIKKIAGVGALVASVVNITFFWQYDLLYFAEHDRSFYGISAIFFFMIAQYLSKD